jgi:acyl-CoA synthetase (AMP-forming)/AMP-acid ligase II
LPEALAQAAARPTQGVAIAGRRGVFEWRSFAQVEAAARLAAGRLLASGVRPRDPLLLLLPTGWDWLAQWFGALLLGAWPMAAAPARALGSTGPHLQRLEALLGPLGLRAVVCSEAARQAALSVGASSLASAALTLERLGDLTPAAFTEARLDPAEVAYLQLTSGSTALPKAVMLSHQNVLEHCAVLDEIIGRPLGGPLHEWAEAWTSWLPLHHDMGLVGCLLMPMLCGLDARLIETTSFLARPRLWLESVGRSGSVAPNLGYQWALERFPEAERAALDLRGFRAALCGAEMVRPETAAAFAAAFAGSGFDPGAFRPCYGLAEATLAVTMDARGEGLRCRAVPGGRGAVACVGEPLPGTEVRIVGPDGSQLGNDQVGEIQVRGPGVFAGYLADPAASAAAFDRGFLRTGDLGFLADGELYVSGRIKDLIIVAGENVSCEEIERLADGVTGGGGLQRCAAFALPGDGHGERLVVVVETELREAARLADAERAVRLAIGRGLALPVADLLFVRRGAIPRTSSGKLQHGRLREDYLAGRLQRLA